MLFDAINSVTPQVKNLVLAVAKTPLMRDEIQHLLKLKDRKSFTDRYLQPALEQKIIEMLYPEKPNTPKQKYRLTSLGKQVLDELIV